MTGIELFGAPISTFVRTARLTAEERGVPYDLIPTPPQGEAIQTLSPSGKIPVLRHGDLVLFETLGICRYLDELGEGAPLFPTDPIAQARALTWCSFVIDAINHTAVRNIVIPNFFPPESGLERDRIQTALGQSHRHFKSIGETLEAGPYLIGMSLSIADLFLYPVVHYLRDLPEGPALFDPNPAILRWYDRLSDRPAMEDVVLKAA